jgi:hypothetical protein
LRCRTRACAQSRYQVHALFRTARFSIAWKFGWRTAPQTATLLR